MSSKKFIWLAIFILTIVCLSACSSSDSSEDSQFVISEEAQSALDDVNTMSFDSLYELGPGANVNSDTLLIVLPGGPNSMLPSGTTPYDDSFSVLYAHQAQTLDPSISMNNNLTEAQAREHNLMSAAIVHRLTQEFKRQNKRVYLIASSFGSSLILKVFQEYDNTADKVVITSGRVNFVLGAVEIAAMGRNVVFPMADDNFMDAGNFSTRANALLAASVFRPRYTEVLRNTSFSNVFYVFVTSDTALGALSSDEQDFLRDRGAMVSGLTLNLASLPAMAQSQGGHLAPIFSPSHAQTIIDFFNQ